MRVKDTLLIVSLGGVIAVSVGCSKTGNQTTGMTDDDLKHTIAARINSDPQLQAYNIDVDADAKNNRVTLSGDVPTEGTRDRIVSAAQNVQNGLSVTDKIDVKPDQDVARDQYTETMAQEARQKATAAGESIGQNLDDAWIHTKIRSKLIGQGEFPFGGINVDVVDKVVTLRGDVNSQKAKLNAEKIAQETDGVKQVNNRLRIKG